MKILFAGGGTLGPVTPLLAILESWKRADPSASFVWVGTKAGPEGALVREHGVKFLHIPVARLPRYVSFEWVTLPFRMAMALVTAWTIVWRERPDLIASSGGYTAVPIAYVAYLAGIPVWTHQPDVKPLLSNRLIAPVARLITVAWEATAKSFPKGKTHVVGNPVRASVRAGAKDRAATRFSLDLARPTVLIFGGGTGATWLNHMAMDLAPWLTERANVIHVTGIGKMKASYQRFGKNYHAVEFLGADMADAIAAADVVLGRAGMGTISELSALGKPAIIVPLSPSPQEDNARILRDTRAAIVFSQPLTTLGDLKKAIQHLLENPAERKALGSRLAQVLPTDGADLLVERLRQLK
jgi:UDP-N-acetylglucosamine--N-acetylmuramyl-(pentapeptide) pyrophosphoryl-undecaprenol N-acetylglucosamine transferase